eukprot:CAMPEP_0197642468 /NCGR_PEP_ID=MMETSP1338-20131121/16115_1 /TAXON_ID=43686 ORGANISM="Pelagodinium beii, Strain RCC1491" /NCGR_SAMPLE_ID=MMETSP1338 /ASSEMBLY_ACC=CAM_ASM_000754 /LENGTH=2163 /DNA_ID=CAMNT_0043215591 /DNA_START=12 /DNA_END=6503 /DNA_ORIENTATION=+
MQSPGPFDQDQRSDSILRMPASAKKTSARKGAAMAMGLAAPAAMTFAVPAQQGVAPSRVAANMGAEAPAITKGQAAGQGRAAGAATLGLGGLLAASANRQNQRSGGSLPTSVIACSATATLDKEMESSLVDPAKKLEEYVKSKGGDKVLKKILIANNGMAATKAILSIRQWAYLELGLDNAFEFVAMATRDDLEANAEFIRLANTFVEVPSGKNVNNYANVDLICEIAKAQGVDAVWPGWGHASENPKLPQKLSEMGVTFIGPTSPVMSVLGDKIAANILAQTAGVPCIPWSGDGLDASLQEDGTIPEEVFKKGCVFSVEEAKASAEKIGFPIMIKASEGGGGKGIRMIDKMEELENAFIQVQNEVVGSPIFMMQLCSGARHIEVQIVGDEHGCAVALNGRDCSTQRRFQKIFEEGPPSIVPRATFREMEKAAQRLTQNLGYKGAGTVEYLYNVNEDKFYFLELNPRLQVEHPVTEEVTRVNMPATQMLVCSGIPLQNLPQIRTFYGKSSDDLTSPINFLEDDYVYPDRHVIAARITAENPDDAFKPTSGKIQRIKFQSSVSCWGYFSVGANGGIHEYADSQFGHIFAHGANREDARKALMLALRNMDIVGEIRNPVEYLVELLKTDAFIQNTIDTSWLDGILAARSVGVKYNQFDIIFNAAIFKAVQTLKSSEDEVLSALEKSQLGPLKDLSKMNSFPIEIAFEGVKYNFEVTRLGPDLLQMSIGGQKFISQVLTQPDGTFFVSTGNKVNKVFGTEEALGLRLRLEGIGTVMLPTLYDPSELRSEFNGKVVRYLQDDGAAVKEGEPYVELEAMKMIMPVKASGSGKISHTAGAGSIVAAGDLLGSLELDDPSKVKKIVAFEGSFQPTDLEDDKGSAGSLQSQVSMLLDGYLPVEGSASLAQKLFAETPAAERDQVTIDILDRFLAVEEKFSSLNAENLTDDQIFTTLINENKESLVTVANLCRAHSQLAARTETVLATLRSVRSLTPSAGLAERIRKLADLTGQSYGSVALVAKNLTAKMSATPFDERLSSLRSKLDSSAVDFQAVSALPASQAGAELLTSLLKDSSEEVRSNALEALMRRLYRSFVIEDLKVESSGDEMSSSLKFKFPGTTSVREAIVRVVPSADKIKDVVKGALAFQDVSSGNNTVKVIVTSSAEQGEDFYAQDADFQSMIADAEVAMKAADENLKSSGVREVGIMMTQAPNLPRYASFMAKDAWKENSNCRDMRPSFPNMLEVYRLAEDYDIERIIPVVGRNSQVYLGTAKNAIATKKGKPSTIFARLITHTLDGFGKEDGAWTAGAEAILLAGVDEIERARLNSKVGSKPNSNILVQFMTNVDMDAVEASKTLEQFMNGFIAKKGTQLQASKVDEIVLKIGIGSGLDRKTTLRLTASSMTGEYLKTTVYEEKVDQIGQPIEWSVPQSGEVKKLPSLDDISRMQTRRLAARAAGSTYAAEFLGMMKQELLSKWDKYHASGGSRPTPADIFKSVELVMTPTGLEKSEREPGQNDIGMVAWLCTMCTPEYPEGREIVMIANDVTFKAGSFGVDEDEFFQKASEYAREHALPRIHIACNSGARVGLAEELKPCVQAKWTDPEDPSKGFEYLYLKEADYKSFPEGTVEAHEVTVDGAKCYALDAIIGEGLKSTKGGIGVENLKGSGLIAGETARAYNEIFTLSYVTGRSVGIGAYLNRLGQRVIQMVNGPMILTGFGALNKLLGKTVYTSQDQLGGPQVMVPNGVTHQLVQSDAEGVSAILDWLAFVPKTAGSSPSMLEPTDPVDRDVTFTPSKRPYDPREMLAGATSAEGEKLTGFFDEGSFQEYLDGWGKSVVTGRAKLGGIPVGVIAVETRNMDRRIPADPANPTSQEVIEPQAGQVWFPDSAFKTATAIKDFNRGENLPLMIFANWRGFSGGTRDMYQEVLKFGAQIVDALVDYKHPVFVYIPPGGELRGGSWVVIDPSINPDQMEMYADVESRGGILEPPGIVEVKFRTPQQKEMMHRLDPELQSLDALLETSTAPTAFPAPGADDVQSKITAREEKLAPLYTQIACEFADLHDRTGRMEAKGVIRKGLEWKRAREFFYWRVKARLLCAEVEREICSADSALSLTAAKELVSGWLSEAGKTEDKDVCAFLEEAPFASKVEGVKIEATKRRVRELYESLPDGEKASALK